MIGESLNLALHQPVPPRIVVAALGATGMITVSGAALGLWGVTSEASFSNLLYNLI